MASFGSLNGNNETPLHSSSSISNDSNFSAQCSRHTIPKREEILTGPKLTTTVFFLDETYEKITYDMTTTVSDVVKVLAGIIKLSAYSSFGLFECRKLVSGSKSPDPGNEEYIGLDDNKYIGDLLAKFKAAKDRKSKGDCKLIFKKKLFLESDEAVTDPVFVELSYVQLQHDYIRGHYLVGRDDAVQLCALQILVEIGVFVSPESCTCWSSLLERFLPKQITRAKKDWKVDVHSCYCSMATISADIGKSVFFIVQKTLGPAGLLCGTSVLGINKRGVHFFRHISKTHLQSVEFADIMQIGSRNTLFLKMRVAGALYIFEFATKQGDQIYLALEVHINDIMSRLYPGTSTTTSVNEEWQRNYDQLLEELHEQRKQEVELKKQLVTLEDLLRSERKNFALDFERVELQCAKKDTALQAALFEKSSLEARLADLSNLAIENNAK